LLFYPWNVVRYSHINSRLTGCTGSSKGRYTHHIGYRMAMMAHVLVEQQGSSRIALMKSKITSQIKHKIFQKLLTHLACVHIAGVVSRAHLTRSQAIGQFVIVVQVPLALLEIQVVKHDLQEIIGVWSSCFINQ